MSAAAQTQLHWDASTEGPAASRQTELELFCPWERGGRSSRGAVPVCITSLEPCGTSAGLNRPCGESTPRTAGTGTNSCWKLPLLLSGECSD